MNAIDRYGMRSVVLTGILALAGTIGVSMRHTGIAEATPAYARRYGLECTSCHSPNPPRLNNVGMVFRRSGFRLPDADESGKLELKAVAASGIGDAMAVAGQIDGHHDQVVEPGASRSGYQLSEVELIMGTAVGERYSTQVLYIPYNDAGESELENAEFQVNLGKPEGQFIVRGGLMQPLVWQKAGHGSMSMSSPLILDEGAPAPIGSFAGPGLGRMLAGIEAGYMLTSLKQGHLMSSMVSVAALNGFTAGGDAAREHSGDGQDVLVQATQLFGSRNTVNAFYYDGHTVLSQGFVTPGDSLRDRYTRMGLTGNYAPIDRIDLAAGYAAGEDKSDELGGKLKSRGYYGEVTGQILPYWVAMYRHDEFDPDTDTADDLLRAETISTTYLVDKTVFLTAEYEQHQAGTEKLHTYLARIRFVY
jgi:hypothetical protein